MYEPLPVQARLFLTAEQGLFPSRSEKKRFSKVVKTRFSSSFRLGGFTNCRAIPVVRFRRDPFDQLANCTHSPYVGSPSTTCNYYYFFYYFSQMGGMTALRSAPGARFFRGASPECRPASPRHRRLTSRGLFFFFRGRRTADDLLRTRKSRPSTGASRRAKTIPGPTRTRRVPCGRARSAPTLEGGVKTRMVWGSDDGCFFRTKNRTVFLRLSSGPVPLRRSPQSTRKVFFADHCYPRPFGRLVLALPNPPRRCAEPGPFGARKPCLFA